MLMGNVVAVDAVPPLFVTVILALPGLAIRLAGTAAVNCVALTNVVVSALPFQFTVAPEKKSVPFTVSVKVGPVAAAEVGLRLVMVGVGTLMVNVAAPEAPLRGFVAVTLALPGLAISVAGTVAVTCPELTNTVVSALPFHSTVAPFWKLDPLTVSVNPDPAAVAELGLRLLIVGITGALMVKVAAPDAVLPLAFTTVTLALPELAIRLAGTTAVSSAEPENEVESAVPFQYTTAPLMKLLPLTVSRKLMPPAVAEFGLRLEIAGALTVKALPADMPPPLFSAVMLGLPAARMEIAGTVAVT
jgi:hypothetical protein